MEENIREKLTGLYNKIMEKPNIIYGIFKDFFGEELVDMQNYMSLEVYLEKCENRYSTEQLEEYCNGSYPVLRELFNNIQIFVRFPEVRVANEYDRYIDIWELYVKTSIKYNGQSDGSFYMNRAEYDIFQLKNDYMHSHISSIPFGNFESFQSPCLGQGPIRTTLALLASEEFDELRWQLFCLELSKYVQVESISGGPYHRIENLGKSSLSQGESNWQMGNDTKIPHFNSFSGSTLKRFVRWLIERKKLKFDYAGSYSIAMSFLQWIIFISNEFIEWYNIEYAEKRVSADYPMLLSEGVLSRGIINDNKLYYDGRGLASDYARYEGRKVCKFKGQDVTLKIRPGEDTSDNMSSFMNVRLAEHILKCILEIVNYEYRDSTKTQAARNGKEIYFI